MIEIKNIANPGLLMAGATPVFKLGLLAAKQCVARPSEPRRYRTTGVTFAVANGDLSQHGQVQTTPMIDATGIPPSAYARRT
ncbi:MAG TPA: hypothetical protein VJX10_01615 [Pseudonocardiaceae bacterium]|nr:hypothetical protein [Pseudonocardiaceae bacterium]